MLAAFPETKKISRRRRLCLCLLVSLVFPVVLGGFCHLASGEEHAPLRHPPATLPGMSQNPGRSSDRTLTTGILQVRALDLSRKEVVAEVTIDGRAAGVTPFDESVRTGKHRVRIKGSTGSWSRGVRIRPGETTAIDAILLRKRMVRLAFGASEGMLVHKGKAYRTHVAPDISIGLRFDRWVADLTVFAFAEQPHHVFVRPGIMFHALDRLYFRGGFPMRVWDGFEAGWTMGPGWRFMRYRFSFFIEALFSVYFRNGFDTVPMELHGGIEFLM